MSEIREASARFPKFSGNKADWKKFNEDFLAVIATLKRYNEYADQIDDNTNILGTGVASTKTSAEDKAA